MLFDLDGTLIDHFSAIHRAVAYAQRQLGLPESDYRKVRATVGGSVPITLGKLCGGADAATEAEPHFREHFLEIMYEDVTILPGAKQLLQILSERGLALAVLTNKVDAHAKSILAHLGLDGHLRAVLGTGDGQPYRKPDPRFTMQALEVLGCSSDECILVGDSPYDFATAEAACLPCHLVATGSHDIEQLQAETNAAGIYPDLHNFAEQFFHLTLPQNP
ncbi:MAG: HAD family hydrolase [Opitutales bacterium]